MWSPRLASSAGVQRLQPARHPRLLQPSKRAGRNNKARTSANTADTVMPISRNGKDSSQTIGRRISASSATGQQSTNKMHHPIKRISTFISSLTFHFCVQRQPPSDTRSVCILRAHGVSASWVGRALRCAPRVSGDVPHAPVSTPSGGASLRARRRTSRNRTRLSYNPQPDF